MIRGDRPDICIFHGSPCFDGFSAAWAIWQKWPDVQFVPGIYGEDPPLELATGKDVLIVDFSYNEADTRALAEVARSVTVLDHHIGAKDTLLKLGGFVKNETGEFEKVITATYADDRSGAALAWEYAWGSTMPALIAYVQDRDLWKFEVDYTREICAVLGSYPQDFNTWTDLAHQIEDPGRRSVVIAEGKAIMRSDERNLRALLAATSQIVIIDGNEVPCANVPYFWASDAGHILGEGHPFAATWFLRADGVRQYSLRSSEDGMDVNAIAKKFGGGGHKHAAGFSVAPETPEAPMKGRGKVERVS